MIVLAYTWGWLLIGAAIGRTVFVRVLGDQPRRGKVSRKDQYGYRYTEEDGWTAPFTRAVVAGTACVVAWPVALPVVLMFAHTGTEKLRARRERLAAEVARLEAEANRQEHDHG